MRTILFLFAINLISLIRINHAIPLLDSNNSNQNSVAEKTQNYWNQLASSAIKKAQSLRPINHQAKSAIIFLGDGMGISTLTAARIMKGQLLNKTGEEGTLNFEQFPNVALVKTYNVDKQVPDSAGTATAYLTGVKANMGVLGLDANVEFNSTDCSKMNNSEIGSIMEMARKTGKSIGVVTTTRITHATPAGSYAHVSNRDWENDSEMPESTKNDGCHDIAYQLIHQQPGQSFNVIFGGGRSNFLSNKDTQNTGRRSDGRNLIEEWKQKRLEEKLTEEQFAYVETLDQLKTLNYGHVKKVLGLFATSHLEYEGLRASDRNSKEPSLGDMTEAAIKILSKNTNGYVLLVEGGRIDHAHHRNYAKHALIETIEFDRAIDHAMTVTNALDTLITVTADHSHGFTVNGYPNRGNSILGLTGSNESHSDNPFTTLLYASGPGHRSPRWNENEQSKMEAFEYQQYAAINATDGHHGGEDVAVYSRGPMAHLLHGLQEQNVIAHVIAFSTCIGSYESESHCSASGHTAAASKTWIYVVILVIIICAIGFYYYRRKRQI